MSIYEIDAKVKELRELRNMEAEVKSAMVDRRYQKDGYYNMVFTSNRDPAQWQENFCENDSLLCALDRIFDDAIVFSIKGESFRGHRLETVSLRSSAASPAAPSQKSGI